MPGETLLIPIIDQCVNPDIAIISQTEDFTITHDIKSQPSPKAEEAKASEGLQKHLSGGEEQKQPSDGVEHVEVYEIADDVEPSNQTANFIEEVKGEDHPNRPNAAPATPAILESGRGILTMTMMEDYMDKNVDQYCTFEAN